MADPLSLNGFDPGNILKLIQGAPAPQPHYPLGTGNLDAADKALKLTPEEKFLYQRHLHNLSSGGVPNEGKTSTLFQTSVEINGKTYNIPTVWNGKIVSPDEAIALAQQEGLDKFPSYASEKEAEARYEKMHEFMEQDMLPPVNPLDAP